MQLKRLFGIALILLLATSTSIFAQKKKPKSPAMETKTQINGVDVTINYGAPSVRERKIWGTTIVKYDQVWRTGANSASTFEVNKDVRIEGQKLPAGKYGFFTIPRANGNWTIIFNSVPDQWGAYNYDESKDVLRVEVKAKASEMTEMMKIDAVSDGTISILWEKIAVPFKVSTK